MEVNKRERNLLKGLVIGSLVGAAAGVVFASRSGGELRSGIKGEAIPESKRLYTGARVKSNAVFERAKNIFGGRDKSDEIILRDLEEPDEFTAEA